MRVRRSKYPLLSLLLTFRANIPKSDHHVFFSQAKAIDTGAKDWCIPNKTFQIGKGFQTGKGVLTTRDNRCNQMKKSIKLHS